MLFVLTLPCWLLAAEALGQGSIQLPEPPRAPAPRNRDREDIERDIDDRRKLRETRAEQELPPAPSPREIRDKRLRDEAIAERPMLFSITASLALSKVFVKSGRKNYTSDPSVLVHAYANDTRAKPEEARLFYGFRLASMSGTGIYENTPGRYGFLYFGPMIGIGKLSPAPKQIGADTIEQEKMDLTRSGYLFATGIAAQSRFASTLQGTPEAKDDMNDKSLAFDAPGIWAEAHYLKVYFGAVAANTLLGVHFGKGKTFVYLGMSAGGWN